MCMWDVGQQALTTIGRLVLLEQIWRQALEGPTNDSMVPSQQALISLFVGSITCSTYGSSQVSGGRGANMSWYKS